MPPTPIHDYTCEVIFNRHCGGDLKVLRLRPDRPFDCQPGQFVMLDLPLSAFHFRRPFSVLSVHDNGEFDLYYKRVGKGTALMWDLKEGDQVNCLGPLGNAFTPPQDGPSALYVGGGIGIAPLYFMGKLNPPSGTCFYGVRSKEEVGLEFELMDVFGERNFISTDDGSFGLKGNVCNLLKQHEDIIQAAQDAYICGPMRMMEASAKLLAELNPGLRIQVSLEEHMPCGTGACTGCVIPRTDQYLPSKVCVEGPVFDARSIQWHGEQLPLSEFCEESPCR